MSHSDQSIQTFSENDGLTSADVLANNVVVTTSPGDHNHGSSKVKLKNLIDFTWEPKYYKGNLLAIHMTGKYLAYCIKVPNPSSAGGNVGMIRVGHIPDQVIERRALIKGLKGEVQDLSFAHIENQVILACIDEHGHFYIHQVDFIDNELSCILIKEVIEISPTVGLHRVLWCPYIPDDDDSPDEDVARLLLTTHSNIGKIWRVLPGNENGPLLVQEHSAPIVSAAFSPDGTALATASKDGYVMFFQVYINNEVTPRSLHKWQPHGGKPLSCLFFLDNHKNYNSEVQFWKFAVTGAENNTILKIWSCKTWSCLQTITFSPEVGREPTIGLNAILDPSATYLLLSDFNARCLYVLHMKQDEQANMACCVNVSEFLLPYSVLSFVINDAREDSNKCGSVCEDGFRNGASIDGNESPEPFGNSSDDLEERQLNRITRISVYIVQPKGLQHGELIYSPQSNAPIDPLAGLSDLNLEEDPPESQSIQSSILQQQSQQLKNLLMRTQTQPGSLMSHRCDSPPTAQLNLMTPDAFRDVSSPGKREEEDPPLTSATPDVPLKPRTSTGVVSVASPRSCGSSPSREVQQIMSPQIDNHTEAEPILPQPDVKAVQNGPNPIFVRSDISDNNSIRGSINEVWPNYFPTYDPPRKQTSEKSSNQSLNTSNSQSRDENNDHKIRSGLSTDDRSKIDALEQKLDLLTDLVQQQNRQIRTLRDSRVDPREQLEQMMALQNNRVVNSIEDILAQRCENLVKECESRSLCMVTRMIEPSLRAMDQRLRETDSLKKHVMEALRTMLSDKSVIHELSNSVSGSLSEMVINSFRDSIITTLVPTMEKAHQNIFRQINTAFQNGAKEFVCSTQNTCRAQLESMTSSWLTPLQQALDNHSRTLQQNQHQATLHVAQVLEKELSQWREQARNVVMEISRSHTPATPASQHGDRQSQMSSIQSLISAGELNSAFQQALSASDLSLVVWLCRTVPPSALFSPPRLRQHVLLSLVQQLAADLTQDTQLKHRYLEEAIMSLDPGNQVTREHLPVVVRELQKQINPFLASNPEHAMRRQFKMLLMAAESLVKNV